MKPFITVDIIIEKDGKIVLIKRAKEPFKDYFALPGGFIDLGEFAEDAAIREAKEETNLDVEIKGILGAYSDPKRDPRGHVISVVFIATSKSLDLKAGDDASCVGWFRLEEIPEKLAFDHKKIIDDYKKYKLKGGTFWSKK
jgi:ADP-ribose pyrophosphatase YjhB (NUDIX family)